MLFQFYKSYEQFWFIKMTRRCEWYRIKWIFSCVDWAYAVTNKLWRVFRDGVSQFSFLFFSYPSLKHSWFSICLNSPFSSSECEFWCFFWKKVVLCEKKLLSVLPPVFIWLPFSLKINSLAYYFFLSQLKKTIFFSKSIIRYRWVSYTH